MLLDAAAHGLDVGDEVGAARGGPHHGRDGLGVGLAQLRVARHRPGLEQGLELPRLGPPLVVGDVPVEGAHQRALPALGPQVRVDLEARLARDPHHPARQPGGGRVGGFGDEDHVDVADVVQLRAAALAHGDHGEPARVRRAVGLGHRDRERRPQRGRRRGPRAARRRPRAPSTGSDGSLTAARSAAASTSSSSRYAVRRAATAVAAGHGRGSASAAPAGGAAGPRRPPRAASRCGCRRPCTGRGASAVQPAPAVRVGDRGGRRARSNRRAGRTAARAGRRRGAVRRRSPSTCARPPRRAGPPRAARGPGRGCGPAPT